MRITESPAISADVLYVIGWYRIKIKLTYSEGVRYIIALGKIKSKSMFLL